MLMILPRFRAIMPFATVRPTMKRLVRLVLMTSSKTSVCISTSGCRRWMPALLTRMSIGPTSRSIFAIASTTAGSEVTSNRIALGLQPSLAKGRDAGLEPLGVAAVDNDRCSCVGKPAGDRLAQAGRRSGDERDLAGQIEQRRAHVRQCSPEAMKFKRCSLLAALTAEQITPSTGRR